MHLYSCIVHTKRSAPDGRDLAVVEQDAGKDVAGGTLSAVASFLDAKWKAELLLQTAAGHPPTSEIARAAAFNVIKTTLDGAVDLPWPLADDDHIGKTQRLVIAPGQTPTLKFSNPGGGSYRVRFKVASP